MDKKANERADLDAFLKRLSQVAGYTPGSIVASEKPDFIITIAGGQTGVEITRLVYQEQVRAQKLHTSKFPHSWGNLTGLKDQQRRRSNEEIAKSVMKNPTDPTIPWKRVADSMLEWKEGIDTKLKSKRQKLNQPDYQIFNENWLLIHHGPPSQIDIYTQHLAQQYLNEIFSKPVEVKRDFDAIFIHSGDYLFLWRERKLSAWSASIPCPCPPPVIAA